MSIFAVLGLAAPLLLLAMAVVALWSYGPLGWLAAVLLIVAVVLACLWASRLVRRWWAGTKAPVRTSTTVRERRAARHSEGPP